jgi:hypothetical protein
VEHRAIGYDDSESHVAYATIVSIRYEIQVRSGREKSDATGPPLLHFETADLEQRSESNAPMLNVDISILA